MIGRSIFLKILDIFSATKIQKKLICSAKNTKKDETQNPVVFFYPAEVY